MISLEQQLQQRLDQRKSAGAFRTLKSQEDKIDFCSNDYLGFARDPALHEAILQALLQLKPIQTGATGSRLISGHHPFIDKLEDRLAKFHQAESALIFNSGYDLNVGLFSSIPQRGDTVLYDQLVHASIRDGIRLGLAKNYVFRHNDLEHLQEKINFSQGQIFIAVESVYSMDGDFAPLTELADICRQTGAALIVDEAHATGVFGPHGEGRVVEAGLVDQVFARIHTFGKALGTHGAVVVGTSVLKNYLINYARPLIYSTALPMHSLLSIACAYDLLEQSQSKIQQLKELIKIFKSKVTPLSAMTLLKSDSAIQGVIIPGNQRARMASEQLQSQGLDVRPILSPTVPKGKERLRICLHAHNTEIEIMKLVNLINMME